MESTSTELSKASGNGLGIRAQKLSVELPAARAWRHQSVKNGLRGAGTAKQCGRRTGCNEGSLL